MSATPEHILDLQRKGRIGVPEAVLCLHKSASQIDDILTTAEAASQRLLLTRLDKSKFAALRSAVSRKLDFDDVSGTAWLGELPEQIGGRVAVVTGGTSDIPVALEAVRTLAFEGHHAELVADVGVAGLWRLLDHAARLQQFRVIIAIAGMEGALFSVLGGLVRAPVIAVPSSVGYGLSEGGRAALQSALTTCAPGVLAVNIDNGYGAAIAACKILNVISPVNSLP